MSKENTLCFTGHRPNKLNGYNKADNFKLLLELKYLIEKSITNDNITTFISGMALGIDMWAAQIVLNLREKYPQVKLVCAIPCDKQYSKWRQENVDEWNSIVERADEAYYVSNEPYTSWCMQKRNEWMVDNSSKVIAVWDGTKGGTGNCVKYAQKQGVEIIQLNPNTLEVTK